MRRAASLLLMPLLVTAASGAPTESQADAGARELAEIRAVFKGEARLQRPVSAACSGETLRSLLAELQPEGLRLSAAPDVADDRVVLFVKDRPAEEVLALVARQLGFRWTKKGTGYELSQGPAGRREEERLRTAAYTAHVAAVRRRMEAVARLAPRAPDQRSERGDQIQRALQDPNLRAEDREALLEERQAVWEAGLPGAAIAAAAYGSLAPGPRAALEAGQVLRWSTRDGSLAPEVAQRILALRTSGGPGDAETKHHADLVLTVRDPATPRLTSREAGVRRLKLEVFMPVGSPKAWAPLSWRPTFRLPDPEPPVPLPKDPLFRTAVILPSPPPAAPVAGEGEKWPAGLPTLAQAAEAIHRASGLDVVADTYTRARLDPKAIPAPVTVGALLQAISDQLRYDWEREGNLLRLRSRTWFQDRRAEVPERLLADWRLPKAMGDGPTLDRLTALAQALDEEQARDVYELWGWYFEGAPWSTGEWASRFYSLRHHLRFWAGLGPRQRATALAGAPVPVREMIPVQREAFRSILARRDEPPGPPGREPLPSDPAALLGGDFRLGATEVKAQRYKITLANGGSIQITQEATDDRPLRPPSDDPASGAHWEAVGPPRLATRLNFEYRLAGLEEPAVKVSFSLPKSGPL